LKKWHKISIVAASSLILLYLLFMGAYFATSTPTFCGWCHEIKPYEVTWRESPHKNVNCLYCHEFRGFLGKLHSKARGLNYVYQQITGQYTIITTTMGVFEQNCIACHLGDYWNYPKAVRLDMKHYTYIKENKSCLICHREIGHKVNIFNNEKFENR